MKSPSFRRFSVVGATVVIASVFMLPVSRASAAPGLPAQLVFTTEPAGASGGTAFGTQPTVTIEDAVGNPVTSDTNPVTLTISSGTGTAGATLSTCSSSTVAGVAAFSGCTIDKAGVNYTLTAADPSDGTFVGVSAAFDVTVGSPSQLVFTTQPSAAHGGTAFGTQPTVTIEDAGGNTVSTDTNTITLAIGTNPSAGTLSGCSATTVAGVAAFSGCKIDAAGTGYTLTATDATDSLSKTSAAFDVTVGAAAQLVFTTQPGNGTGGSALSTQPTVTIEDAGGNTVSTDTNTITLAIGTNPSGGTLSGCSASTVAGVAAFSGCKIDEAGTGYTLTATDAGDGLTLPSAPSSAFDVTVGSASQLVFTTQPSGAVSAVAFSTQPTVTIEDAGGNTVSTDTNTITLAIGTNPSAGTLSGCSSSTVAGVAAFSGCKIDKAGTGYTLTATDAGDSLSKTSTPFDVNAGAPAQLVFTTQPGNGTGGSALSTQPTVTIEDAHGNTVTTDANTITLAIGTNPSAGTLSGCSATTVAGVAAFSGCKIDAAGTGYTLTATDAGDGLTSPSAPSSAFNVTVGPAAQLVFTTQPGNGTGGSALSTQPTVTIEDAGGNTVSTDTNAITLAIGTNPSAGTLSGCSSSTVAGVAAFSGCKIDAAGTGYTLTATDAGDGLTSPSAPSSAFDVTVGSPSQLVFTTQPGNGTGGSALSTQPTVTIEDAGGNTVSTDTNTITLAIGTNPSAGTLSGCSATTVAGVAAFSGCKIDAAGTGYTLTATDAGDSLTSPSVPSSAFDVTVGPAAQLVFTTQPGNGTGGSALSTQPTVTIEDAGGNTVSTDTNTITLAIGTNPSGGTLSGCQREHGGRRGRLLGLQDRQGRHRVHADGDRRRRRPDLAFGAEQRLRRHRRLGVPARLHHPALRCCERGRLQHPAHGHHRGCRRQHGEHRHQHDHLRHRHQPERGHPLGLLLEHGGRGGRLLGLQDRQGRHRLHADGHRRRRLVEQDQHSV